MECEYNPQEIGKDFWRMNQTIDQWVVRTYDSGEQTLFLPFRITQAGSGHSQL